MAENSASANLNPVLATIRPQWQSAVYALGAITLAFAVPGIALCKVVSLPMIVWAIVAATAGMAVILFAASVLREWEEPLCPKVEQYLQASIFVAAAAMLWGQMAIQRLPVRERSFDPVMTALIVLACLSLGARLLKARANRRMRLEA